MSKFEYKVVPAPVKGVKARGVKSAEARFANALQEVMNHMGASGWEYQRAETLPSQERSGLTGSVMTYRNVLVFRRPLPGGVSEFRPVVLDTPVIAPALAPEPQEATDAHTASTENDLSYQPDEPSDDTEFDKDRPAGQPGATKMLRDNGVEELSEVSGMTKALEVRASQKGDEK